MADEALEKWPEKTLSMFSGWPMPVRIASRKWAMAMKKGKAAEGSTAGRTG